MQVMEFRAMRASIILARQQAGDRGDDGYGLR